MKTNPLTETLVIEVDGFNQSRLLSELVAAEITARNITRESASKISFEIAKKDGKKTFAILEKLCYNYSVVVRGGLKNASRRWLARAGLIIGLIVFLTLTVLSYGFIWRIDVRGTEKLDPDVVIRQLKSMNVSVGASKKNVDEKALVKALNAMDEIVESTVEIVGTTVVVSVFESTDYVPRDETEPADILSGYDAEITRVNAERGTSMVKAGDRVAKDSVLISGSLFNTEGEEIERVRAQGEVYGKVAFKESCVFSTVSYKTVRTGRTYKKTDVGIFGLTWRSKVKHGFTSFETVTTEETFSAFLPVRARRTVYYETALEQVTRTEEEVAAEFTAAALEKNVFKTGGTVLRTVHTVEDAGGGTFKLSVYIEAEILIGSL